MNNLKELAGKKLGNAEFVLKGDELFGRVNGFGVTSDFRINPITLKKPVEGILMDLDGTTLTSEEFWIFIIEETMKSLMGDKSFALCNADVPFVSGFTTAEHLKYCINKYSPDKDINNAIAIYHRIAESELAKIIRGEGRADTFKPTRGLKEFLTEIKRRKIKIGLATSGLAYKAIPEIVAVFRMLDMGDPLKFYDSIITGGNRKDINEYGTIGEIASKPHPFIYTELAYMGLKINNPEHVLGIEDSAAGVMALRFANFPVMGVKNGNISDSGLDSLCLSKVDSLAEILDLL